WDHDPFGNGLPSGTFSYHLRFPGQFYDHNAKLHYNYFRDYDPNTGRYIESDPAGLGGGISTYAHAGGNPVGDIDPLSLKGLIPDIPVAPDPSKLLGLEGIEEAARLAVIRAGEITTYNRLRKEVADQKASGKCPSRELKEQLKKLTDLANQINKLTRQIQDLGRGFTVGGLPLPVPPEFLPNGYVGDPNDPLGPGGAVGGVKGTHW
ncbi:MAG: RHS repeat-associated core domain-containing protein, partial [Methylocella sp.]